MPSRTKPESEAGPAPPPAPDDALVRRCRDGDGRAWEELVTKYRSLVYAAALGRGLRDADAADAFQATWIRVHRALPRLGRVDRLAGWIATVARNEASRVGRGIGAARRLEAGAAERARAATDSAPDAEAFQSVREGLDRLGGRCRDLLRLLYWEEASYAEIVRRLGMAQGSIGPTRARCLERLRGLVGAGEERP